MEAKLQTLKVADLKKLLQDAKLPVSGAKAELVKRLMENPEAAASVTAEDEEDLLGETAEETITTLEQPAAPLATAPAAAVPSAKPAEATTGTSKAESAGVDGQSADVAAIYAPIAAEKDQETRKAEVIAELEKRKARAQKFGMPTEEIEAKLHRIHRFGLEEEAAASLQALDGELKGGKGRKEARAEKRATAANGGGKGAKQPETEEEKAARAAQRDAAEAARRQRAERFGTQTSTPAAPLDPVEEEKKRKRMERFGLVPDTKEPSDKKVKT